MGLDRQFMAEVHRLLEVAGGEVELLPSVLARACVTVLGVAGASISLMGALRVPLGSSGAGADCAERLQTTLGEGPCLAVTRTSEPVVVTAAAMAARWPLYQHELLAQTPFRAVASIPLHTARVRGVGALDLYAIDPDTLTSLSLSRVANDVADQIAAVLFDTPEGTNILFSGAPVGWLANSSVVYRMAVWTAVGMVSEHSHLSTIDALASLRAYAYSHGATLDDTAAQLTSKQISPRNVLS